MSGTDYSCSERRTLKAKDGLREACSKTRELRLGWCFQSYPIWQLLYAAIAFATRSPSQGHFVRDLTHPRPCLSSFHPSDSRIIHNMDEDITFGSSVWATPATAPMTLSPRSHEDALLPSHPPPASSTSSEQNDQFEDFDDFGSPADTPQLTSAQDDDFGDFGDFGDVQDSSTVALEDAGAFGGGFADDAGFDEQVRMAGPSTHRDWEPLHLDPHNMPSRSELEEQIEEILSPLWADDDLDEAFTDEDIREVGGLSQILITPER